MIISYTENDVDMLARIMRAEALNEGELGMLMVGNVVVNRVLANCLTFKNIRSIYDAIYQKNQFTGINSPLYQASATTYEKDLAKRILNGEYYYPATNALWFYSPSKGASCKSSWYNQKLSGRYKNHCFYIPEAGLCNSIY
ncbi:MAG: cell wall hydrolase [Bacilli bacterium]|nr:cell wall hydrolase [Bacilli bacterium]